MSSLFDSVFEKCDNGKKVYRNFVHGQWSFPESAGTFDVKDPATGNVFAAVPLCSERHMEEAIETAEQAHTNPEFKPTKRLKVIERAAELLDHNDGYLIDTLVTEAGKPISGARKEVHTTAERLHLAREEARALYGQYIPGQWVEDTEGKFAIVLRNPLGVVAALSPFNYPLFIAAAKIIPALLAGNSVVAKPASDTPLSLLLFARILQEAGLPDGRLQVLTGKGSELGPVIAESSKVAAITFTGSTVAGKALAKGSGMKKLHLELGGKAAAIVMNDADIEIAAREVCKGTFKNSGQRCDAISRVLVHESVHKKFIEAVVKETAEYRIGKPWDPETKVGPLINRVALDKVDRLVTDAIQKGADTLTGALFEGLYYTPTIIDKVTLDMEIAKEEIFGPVMPIMTFGCIDEAVKISNSSQYGLDSCIFTENLRKALSVAKQLTDGTVSINTAPAHGVGHFPFGGNKNSGIGREGLKYSIDELTRLHTIVISE